MKQFLRRLFSSIVSEELQRYAETLQADRLAGLLIRDRMTEACAAHPLLGPPLRRFSQNDEDGIIERILARAHLTEPGVFVEIGVGDGLENNTLGLLAGGWRGAWLGAEDLRIETRDSRLSFRKSWLTRDNVVSEMEAALKTLHLQTNDVRLISVDLDGNDAAIVEAMLVGSLRPDVFVVEYNAKFGPRQRFVMPYDAAHVWRHDDYFGCSLTSWIELFARFGYRPVACNLTGANVFFVSQRIAGSFADVPSDAESLFIEGHYAFLPRSGHPTSPRTVEAMIR